VGGRCAHCHCSTLGSTDRYHHYELHWPRTVLKRLKIKNEKLKIKIEELKNEN